MEDHCLWQVKVVHRDCVLIVGLDIYSRNQRYIMRAYQDGNKQKGTSTLFYSIIIERHTAHMQCWGASFSQASCAVYLYTQNGSCIYTSNVKTETPSQILFANLLEHIIIKSEIHQPIPTYLNQAGRQSSLLSHLSPSVN